MAKRGYKRTTRLNELLREILGEELARIDDDRLDLVTISGVDVDSGLSVASVYYSSLDGPERDAEILEALEDRRVALQRTINRQTTLKGTPRLQFFADEGIRAGERVDEILRGLTPPDQSEE